MGARERVQAAIDSATSRAEKNLAEAPNADPHERLTILVNGWFQGIAAALEEIAVELDARDDAMPEIEAPTRPAPPAEPDDNDEPEPKSRATNPDEGTQLDRARASIEETRALREEREAD
jgi:hypothetical protein